MKAICRLLCGASCLILSVVVCAQNLTLTEAVEVMVLQTSRARSLRLGYENQALEYQNYQKGFLPGISFSFSPFSLNRSILRMQQPTDGRYTYVEDYSASSAAGLTVHQKVGFTGGSFTVGTSLNFLNEFTDGRRSFNSRPFYVSYSQPLWGGYRDYRFTRQQNHLSYHLASRQYAHNKVSLQQQVLSSYMQCFLNQLSYEHAVYVSEALDTLMQVARIRNQGGLITEYDFKQIELSCAESQLEVVAGRQKLELSRRSLALLLELPDARITPDCPSLSLPDISSAEVDRLTRRNNASYLQTELQMVRARQALWTARKENTVNGNISIDYGVNQYGSDIALAYRRPSTQQAVALTLSFPMFQWGVGRNKRKIAENQYEMQEISVEQTRREFENRIVETVVDYNNVLSRCALAERTYRLAQENFRLKVQRFLMDRISVTELIDARRTLHGQMEQYYTAFHTLYTAYYEIRQMTLYDFERHRNIWEIL